VPRGAFQMRDVGAGIGQHIVHARLLMWGLRHRSVEADTLRKQPPKCFRNFVGQHTPQRRIVARVEIAVKSGHVAPMID